MPIEPLAEVWTPRKGSRVARCEVAAHPCGLELRCSVDGELVRSQAFRETDALKLEAHAWLEAFGATDLAFPARHDSTSGDGLRRSGGLETAAWL